MCSRFIVRMVHCSVGVFRLTAGLWQKLVVEDLIGSENTGNPSEGSGCVVDITTASASLMQLIVQENSGDIK